MQTRHRKSQPPSSITSITQWFRAASQVGKSFIPQRDGCPPGQPFSLLICRHILRSHFSIGTPAPPLCRPSRSYRLAACIARTPPHLTCSGPVHSRDIRVDRSTLQSVSSSEDDRGISRHCFGMVCFALSTYAESHFICRIPTIPRHRTNFQGITHRGRCVGCFPFAVLCQTEYIVIQRVRLRGGREIQSLRLPRLHDIQMFWGATLPGAETYRSALWHQPLTDSPRHTLAHTAKNLLPRRVRSDGSGALRQGRVLATQALKR